MASSQPESLYTATGAAATPSSSNSKTTLSIDDISRLFSLPISEAASSLGVSTGVLKRLCRKNGIAKWPYRQLLSGKSLEDIRKEAEIEKLKDQNDPEKIGKRQTGAKSSPSIATGPSKTIADQDHRVALRQGFQQGNQIASPNFGQLSPTKHIPTYMDEFKYGFPSNGLSSISNKWWASEEKPAEEETETVNTSACDALCSLRRKSMEETRDSIKTENKPLKLKKRQKLVLMKVFGSSFPNQWKN